MIERRWLRVRATEVLPGPGGRKLVMGEEATLGPVVLRLSPRRADSDLTKGCEITLALPLRTTDAELRRAIREPVHHLVAEDNEAGLFTQPNLPGSWKALDRIPFLCQEAAA